MPWTRPLASGQIETNDCHASQPSLYQPPASIAKRSVGAGFHNSKVLPVATFSAPVKTAREPSICTASGPLKMRSPVRIRPSSVMPMSVL